MKHWEEETLGLRGSSLIGIGSLAMIVAGLFSLAAIVDPIVDSVYRTTFIATGRVAWIVSLLLQGIGFTRITAVDEVSRWGIAVGLMHIIHGIFFSLTLFFGLNLFIPFSAIAIARLMLLVIFAGIESANIRQMTAVLLIVAPLLIVGKILARISGLTQNISEATGIFWDSCLIIILGMVLIDLAKSLRNVENLWILSLKSIESVGLGELNNPEHPWNR